MLSSAAEPYCAQIEAGLGGDARAAQKASRRPRAARPAGQAGVRVQCVKKLTVSVLRRSKADNVQPRGDHARQRRREHF